MVTYRQTYQVGVRFEAFDEGILMAPLEPRYTQVGFNFNSVQVCGGDFSVGHIVLDFDLKLLLCWTNAFGHTLLGSFVYVVICWAVEDTLCWAVGHWASVALCWAVIIICTLLGSFYCMESVGHVQQSYW